MKVVGSAGAVVLAFLAAIFLLPESKSPQQRALIELAEAAGYKVRNTPGYGGAWWVTAEVPGCKNKVGLRSEEAPQDHVPTRYVLVRLGPTPYEVVSSYVSDNASAATLRRLVPSEAHLDCR